MPFTIKELCVTTLWCNYIDEVSGTEMPYIVYMEEGPFYLQVRIQKKTVRPYEHFSRKKLFPFLNIPRGANSFHFAWNFA